MRAFGLTVEVTASDAPDGGWDHTTAERVVDLRNPDGTPFLHVDRGPLGYRLDSPAHGLHLVDAGGGVIRTGRDEPDGERLLVAQSLPTAAALQGLDPMHASAVLTPRGVVAISGPSTSGKSTLAGRLAQAGVGEPFADDVIALDDVAHARPGPGHDRPAAPVVAFVLLDRTDEPGDLRVTAADPNDLFGAAFVPHVTSPERLRTHLDACAALLAAGVVHRLVVPPGTTVEATAERLAVLTGG